ncbi:tetratricopeptide repeat protein [Candidatus Pelagibacter sp. Uisw_104]|uniref:protein arginine N-methyltransferase n=1 Tax=unclassified Candidatus Pelagibacter TaxID=2647897 RepID=UPI0039E8540A
MIKYNDLTIDELFSLAVKNYKENNIEAAQELYNQILKIDPNNISSINNLGSISRVLGEDEKAKSYYEKVIEINPNYPITHYNMGNIFKKKGEIQKAISCYEKAITIDPNYISPHINLGIIFQELAEDDKAKDCYEKVIIIEPNYTIAHNNLGNIFKKLGEHKKAISCFEKAIEINPDFTEANYNLGVIFHELGKYEKAKNCYEKTIKIDPKNTRGLNNLGHVYHELNEDYKSRDYFKKAIEINPDFTGAHWNSQGCATGIDEALIIFKKINKIDNTYINAKIMIGALQGYKGNFDEFNSILASPHSQNPYARSVKWVFSLPKLPKLFFNRWKFFDAVIELTEKTRPFYEFGVWYGISFKHLINTFKKGYGFDTFTGIPEAWHNEPKGNYSSFGAIPKIEGGKFIVGKFEDTLEDFFSEKRPIASLINFDADLYSSTLCALNNSDKVIDEKTILVFDEFISNDKWEEDEYKALNEFCSNFGYSYEVIAVSFFTKQVAVKLKR